MNVEIDSIFRGRSLLTYIEIYPKEFTLSKTFDTPYISQPALQILNPPLGFLPPQHIGLVQFADYPVPEKGYGY